MMRRVRRDDAVRESSRPLKARGAARARARARAPFRPRLRSNSIGREKPKQAWALGAGAKPRALSAGGDARS